MGFLLPAVLLVVVDQLAKQLIWHFAENTVLIPGYFNLALVRNGGAAFGVFQGARWAFVAASIVAMVVIMRVGLRLPREAKLRRLYLGMILGGAVGNLIDRVFAGTVIDFIQIGVAGHYWPVFNVADMGVSIGATLLLIDILFLSRHRDARVPLPSGESSDSGDAGRAG